MTHKANAYTSKTKRRADRKSHPKPGSQSLYNRSERRMKAHRPHKQHQPRPERTSRADDSRPNPHRRTDEAKKLLHRANAVLVKEVLGAGKRRIERFFIVVSGRSYKVRKKIAGLLLSARGVLQRIATGFRTVWTLTFLGKSWVEVTL